MNRALFLTLVVASSLGAPPARAGGDERARAEARALGEQGDAQFYAGRCDKAVPIWRRADALFHAPTLVLRVARCQAILGQVVAAAASLQAVVDEAPPARAGAAEGSPLERDSPAFASARDDARRELPRVRARIASLRVVVRQRGVHPAALPVVVEIDGAPTGAATEAILIDPGVHQVHVHADRAAWSREVHLDDGEARTLDLAFWAEPLPSVPRPQRNAGLVVLGAGVAALATGAGLSASALGTAHALAAICGPDRMSCPPSAQPAIDRTRAYSLAADGALIGGAVLAVGGAVLLTADFHLGLRSRVRLTASPRALGLVGEL